MTKDTSKYQEEIITQILLLMLYVFLIYTGTFRLLLYFEGQDWIK